MDLRLNEWVILLKDISYVARMEPAAKRVESGTILFSKPSFARINRPIMRKDSTPNILVNR